LENDYTHICIYGQQSLFWRISDDTRPRHFRLCGIHDPAFRRADGLGFALVRLADGLCRRQPAAIRLYRLLPGGHDPAQAWHQTRLRLLKVQAMRLLLLVALVAAGPALAQPLTLDWRLIPEMKAVYGTVEARDTIPARARIGGT